MTLKMLCLQMNQFVGKKKFMINELDSIIKNLVWVKVHLVMILKSISNLSNTLKIKIFEY